MKTFKCKKKSLRKPLLEYIRIPRGYSLWNVYNSKKREPSLQHCKGSTYDLGLLLAIFFSESASSLLSMRDEERAGYRFRGTVM